MCLNTDVEDLGMYCEAADVVSTMPTPPQAESVSVVMDETTAIEKRVRALLADTTVPGPHLFHGRGGTKSWHRPATLSALLQALVDGGMDARMVAGNTGAGVCKDWPNAPVLIDLRGVDLLGGATWDRDGINMGLRIGGACTLNEVTHMLSNRDTPYIASHMGLRLANHLRRIAGAHVQHAATVGGNLALARSKGLASDLVTPLLVLESAVEVASPSEPDSLYVGGYVLMTDHVQYFSECETLYVRPSGGLTNHVHSFSSMNLFGFQQQLSHVPLCNSTMLLVDYLATYHDPRQVVVAVHVPTLRFMDGAFWTYKVGLPNVLYECL